MGNKLEQLYGPMLRGQLVTLANSKTFQWAGKAAIASGDATIVVSVTNVCSDSLIFIAEQHVSDASSGVNLRSLCVKSITDGSYFTIGTTDGKGVTRGRTVAWLMMQTK